MTTEAAATAGAVVVDERAELEATLVELEGRPQSQFRAVAGPAATVERRATDLGDEALAMRARLLRATALVREGKSEQGGRWAHQVLDWSQQHDNPFLLSRAHRVLSIFYRQIGDLSEGLAHAVHCFANLTDDEPDTIRARHLMTLAVALDESGSIEEGDRRFREALALATAEGDLELTLNILNNMAYTAFENDNEPGALDLVEHMRAVQLRAGRDFGALELDTIARIEMMGGRYADVEQTLGFLVDGQSTVESHEGDASAVCLLTLAEARRLDRRYTAAQEALDASVRLAEDRGLDRVRAQAREEQAALYAATGRFHEAYEEHKAFYAAATALHSTQREAQARALQAVFEATEARRASEHFREMAHRDALTGLYNRRYVNERLPALLGEAVARRTPVSVAILDLDHFKRVNDTLSHSTGDTVLQEIAQLLLEAASGPMIAARMGGEEFLLVMPGLGIEEATERCERLRLRIRAHAWEPVTGALTVTTSIGVTTAPEGRATPSTLLSLADRNLYVAKREGRDRVIADL
ncbi:GGDEF domain-containing protein [Actinoplanes friuliensis]|uniref:Cellulose synthesis regulatory protein n=1 Tax=Actinoplanes friuliensis DSM 7358 TaxID=1246995 RepID=U5W709_9ACTN|nr:GGDEF domain-containing protein [Actinoplanes friuliensis]AGZ44787.1 Cellulose synthesis regulatory protein [Actinoplanes friuliensis DSM 7358]